MPIRVVVDNTRGADPRFAGGLREALEVAGFEVDVREPAPTSMYDTAVHFVVEGIAVRVPDGLARRQLEAVADAVREAERRRDNERRRVRAVPIYRGETTRVVAWVDVFGGM